ncbi:hypothetical protein ACO34A_28675 (plasmid) [Rhizobium sp. ACO-34A]|nr:cellulase family glycosylhydrolase [Rhizobium sp. ACO-34A]ATN37741.1 hypothetical protein ACO34A_28675 [Rhizobium sp. ACO-34A]
MSVEFTGVNLSGLEFGGTGGTLGTNYIANGETHYDYWSDAGANTIRLPFTWERLQPQANGALDADYLQLLHDAVDYAQAHGQLLILDMHNFGEYSGQSMAGGSTALKDAYADVWEKIANEFKDEPNVWFGIMNEPHDIAVGTWMDFAQAATDAIRDTGAENKILVPTVDWSGAYRFNDTDYLDEMAAYEAFTDPANNFAFEIHQYLDQYSGGVSGDAVDGRGATVMQGVTDWARENGFELFVGEFGVAADGANADEYTDFLNFMDANSDVFLGWTAWGAGEWWPTSYHYYLGAQDGSGTDILDDFFNPSPVDFDNEANSSNFIRGTSSSDILTGTSVADTILGNAGNDVLEGLAGDDVLNGQAGDDVLFGGAGSDTFVYQTGGGIDYVKDFNLADDVVSINVAGYETFAEIQPLLQQWGPNVAIYFDANNYLVIENSSLTDLSSRHFTFDTSRSLFTGTSTAEYIGGTNGRDTILGGVGNDVLEGFAGNDILNGQAGDDVLFGGDGNDIFVFQSGGGVDYAKDFDLAHDQIKIDVVGYDEFADIQPLLQQWGSNTAIYLDANNYLVLENVSTAGLNSSHFLLA